jgi:hypothetical protein
LIYVLGHRGIGGNEIANELARLGAEDPFTGPEPACRASAGVPEKAVRDWIIRNHMKYWESLTGLKYEKGFLQRTSARKNWVTAEIKQKPITVGNRYTCRTLPPERPPF